MAHQNHPFLRRKPPDELEQWLHVVHHRTEISDLLVRERDSMHTAQELMNERTTNIKPIKIIYFASILTTLSNLLGVYPRSSEVEGGDPVTG